MVRAILGGYKTQTRRIVKPQPDWPEETNRTNIVGGIVFPIGSFGQQCGYPVTRIPYQIGDILWVRETWQHSCRAPGIDICYRADGEPESCDAYYVDNHWCKWKPAIHMSKEAARIFLQVTGVRVERLQDITAQDAEREGFKFVYAYGLDSVAMTAYEAFAHYWNCINAKRDEGAYAYEKNPWVWVYTFERCEKPEVTE